MERKQYSYRPSFAEILLFLAALVFGLGFVWIKFTNVVQRNHRNALDVAQSVVASLPKEKLFNLEALLSDTNKQEYKDLKALFLDIIKKNTNARFAYLYVNRNGKCYFLLDSEPSTSADCSPPGQYFSEAADAIKQPFYDGKSLVTAPTTDRWGEWISVLVPIRDKNNDKIFAVYGMDINAKSWNRIIFLEVAESFVLVVVLIVLGMVVLRFRTKNRNLQNEVKDRLETQKALSESEERYRLIYENASIGIYRTTPDGQILLSNNALLKILGYKSFDELKARNIEKDEFDPDYSRAEFKKTMEEKGEIFGLEDIWKRQDDRLVYIRENAKAVRDNQGNILFYDGTIEDITESKLAEKALRYSEERFQQIAEQSREVVWEVDKNGLYIYISPLSISVLGYAPDELIGKKYFYDLHPEATRDEFKIKVLEGYGRKEDFRDYISLMVKGTGETIWVINNGVPILDENGDLIGYRGAGSDITERIEKEKLLKKLTLAVEQSPVSIFITNVFGEIEYVNPQACKTSGYTPEELTGKTPSMLKSGLIQDAVYQTLWETINSGKIWHGEFLNKRKDGVLYWEAATISPIFDNNGVIINYLAVKEDITHIKKMVSELKDAKNKAESGDRMKSAFIKSISHEIRTPLFGIVGISEEIIKPGFSQGDKEQMLGFIKESSARLINTVNSYLDISMIVSGNMKVQMRNFDLVTMLHGLKDELMPACESKGLDLQLYIHENEKQFDFGSDAELIRKILIHLLDNAVKFTESGLISFGYDLMDKEIVLFVKDTGIGIDNKFLPDIYETFTQADDSDTRAYEGSGLGLAIVYRLVQLLS
ncbi:MAG: PAS domain-containing sensor histidine kinase, partial [Bacteroidales bacterium]